MTTCITPVQQQHYSLINTLRVQNGLRPLQISHILHETAAFRAQDMADKDYFSHDTPGRGSARDVTLSFGYPTNTSTGENILWGTGDPMDAFTVWANSPAHRANILSPHYTEVGIALNVEPSWDYQGDIFAVGVQVFGGAGTPPARACHDGAPPLQPPREPKPTLPDEPPPRETKEERKAARKAQRAPQRRHERLLTRLLRRFGVRP